MLESWFSAQVSALNASARICSMFAGTGPLLAVMTPPQRLQLRVLSSRCRYSPPAFTSCLPAASKNIEKLSRNV